MSMNHVQRILYGAMATAEHRVDASQGLDHVVTRGIVKAYRDTPHFGRAAEAVRKTLALFDPEPLDTDMVTPDSALVALAFLSAMTKQ